MEKFTGLCYTDARRGVLEADLSLLPGNAVCPRRVEVRFLFSPSHTRSPASGARNGWLRFAMTPFSSLVASPRSYLSAQHLLMVLTARCGLMVWIGRQPVQRVPVVIFPCTDGLLSRVSQKCRTLRKGTTPLWGCGQAANFEAYRVRTYSARFPSLT